MLILKFFQIQYIIYERNIKKTFEKGIKNVHKTNKNKNMYLKKTLYTFILKFANFWLVLSIF